jgi:hypothetical protein
MIRQIDIEDLLYWAFRQEKVETNKIAHEDALTVYWAVMALPAPFDHLIRHHARIGRPPDWHFTSDAKVVHLVAVRYWRERYEEWHKALTVLQRTVNGALRSFTATGPVAPELPWRNAAPTFSGSRPRVQSALHSIP